MLLMEDRSGLFYFYLLVRVFHWESSVAVTISNYKTY